MYENISRRNNQHFEGILFEEVPVESEEDEEVELQSSWESPKNLFDFSKEKIEDDGEV